MAYTTKVSASNGGLHPAMEAYGQKAATAILSRVSRLPPSMQKPTLTKILGTLDPNLWSRTQTIADRYKKQGASPAAALHHGLARAMSTGLLAEVVRRGEGAAVKPRSQLGHAMGLGATAPVFAMQAATVSQSVLCSADGKMAWLPTAGSVAGFSWQPLKPGQVCGLTPVPCTANGFTTDASGAFRRPTTKETCSGTVLPGGPTVNDNRTPDPNAGGTAAGETVQVGPWLFAANRSGSILMKDPKKITPDIATYLKGILTGVNPDIGRKVASSSGDQAVQPVITTEYVRTHVVDPKSGMVIPYGTTLQRCDWLAALGIQCGQLASASVVQNHQGNFVEIGTPIGGDGVYWHWFAPDNPADLNWEQSYPPIAKFKNPDDGTDWGVYLAFAGDDAKRDFGPDLPSSPTKGAAPANPVYLRVYSAPIPQEPWYGPILNSLNWLTAKIFDGATQLVKDALNVVSNLTCDLLSGQSGQVAGAVGGAVIGTYAGGPKGAQAGAAAGQAGATVANKACNPPPPPPPVQSSSLLVPVLVVGVGALFIIALNKKKPTTTPKAPSP